jgi:alkanesulfonate monooxygenase SsuD/methylene tetrahydromethanopterin reductase-like flavin-dependent oxidoreductase (luciferase family)
VKLDATTLPGLVEQAQAAERAGVEVVWVRETPETGPPLLTIAALATHTRTLRFVACVSAGDHPLAIAEAAVVADLCTNGRLVLEIPAGETADAVRLALQGRPFRHVGERWTSPANRPENDGATPEITVTPPSVQRPIPQSTSATPGRR